MELKYKKGPPLFTSVLSCSVGERQWSHNTTI